MDKTELNMANGRLLDLYFIEGVINELSKAFRCVLLFSIA